MQEKSPFLLPIYVKNRVQIPTYFQIAAVYETRKIGKKKAAGNCACGRGSIEFLLLGHIDVGLGNGVERDVIKVDCRV